MTGGCLEGVWRISGGLKIPNFIQHKFLQTQHIFLLNLFQNPNFFLNQYFFQDPNFSFPKFFLTKRPCSDFLPKEK